MHNAKGWDHIATFAENKEQQQLNHIGNSLYTRWQIIRNMIYLTQWIHQHLYVKCEIGISVLYNRLPLQSIKETYNTVNQ